MQRDYRTLAAAARSLLMRQVELRARAQAIADFGGALAAQTAQAEADARDSGRLSHERLIALGRARCSGELGRWLKIANDEVATELELVLAELASLRAR